MCPRKVFKRDTNQNTLISKNKTYFKPQTKQLFFHRTKSDLTKFLALYSSLKQRC